MPISQKCGHGTRNTTLPGTRIVRPTSLGIRSRGTTRWAPRLGRRRVEPPDRGDDGSAPHTPVASITTRARTSPLAPVSVSHTRAPTTRPPSSSRDSARALVTIVAPSSRALRATASV